MFRYILFYDSKITGHHLLNMINVNKMYNLFNNWFNNVLVNNVYFSILFLKIATVYTAL